MQKMFKIGLLMAAMMVGSLGVAVPVGATTEEVGLVPVDAERGPEFLITMLDVSANVTAIEYHDYDGSGERLKNVRLFLHEAGEIVTRPEVERARMGTLPAGCKIFLDYNVPEDGGRFGEEGRATFSYSDDLGASLYSIMMYSGGPRMYYIVELEDTEGIMHYWVGMVQWSFEGGRNKSWPVSSIYGVTYYPQMNATEVSLPLLETESIEVDYTGWKPGTWTVAEDGDNEMREMIGSLSDDEMRESDSEDSDSGDNSEDDEGSNNENSDISNNSDNSDGNAAMEGRESLSSIGVKTPATGSYAVKSEGAILSVTIIVMASSISAAMGCGIIGLWKKKLGYMRF